MTVETAGTESDSDLLHAAFRTFDQAAATLQQSYQALTARLERLDLELADRNEALRRNLRVNEELREHLTGILESVSTGILVTDDRGTITRSNQAGEHLLGLAREEIVGRTVAACLDRAGLDDREFPLMTKTGAMVSLSSRDLTSPGGAGAGSLTLIQDVTAVHRLEERLQRRNRLAAMGEMIGRIAHEIRNPLGSIELFASMLRRDLDRGSPVRSYAEHISSSVQLLDRLLSNLLLYSKPDCSRAEWHDTETIVTDALTMAAHAVAGSRIDIRLRIDPSAGRMWCDAGQLRQALLNLILNAVQAMAEGGALTISVDAVQEQPSQFSSLRLSITDTGIGMTLAVCARVFDPFFTTKDEGTGLGLAIVHAIVEAHRGRIDVASTPGRGTTFTILLPQTGRADAANREPDLRPEAGAAAIASASSHSAEEVPA